MELVENEKIRLWLTSLKGRTAIEYRKWLLRFFEETRLRPEEFLELCRDKPSEAKAIIYNYLKTVKSRGHYIRTKDGGYYLPPEKEEISEGAKKQIFSAVKSFINFYKDEYGIRLELSLRGVLRVKKQKHDYIPSVSEVLMLLDRSQVNLKPCIALMAFSGMRPSDIVAMRFENVMDEIEWKEDEKKYVVKKVPLKIVLKQRKTGEFYVT
ncbi:MAG: hypothetical protein ACTSW6_05730, partial [Candidatus Baldrarchaeia archaeon]